METIKEQIVQLKKEIHAVEEEINQASQELIADEIRIYRLKKRNKTIREQIQKLESMLQPDIIA